MNIKTMLMSTLVLASFAMPASAADLLNAKHATISAKMVMQAIKDLGLSAEQHKDKGGDPHFVLKDAGTGAKSVAIFMDDCKNGMCEDVTFYADFGPVAKVKAATLNEWNHIGTKLRSKVFRSGSVDNANGSIGMSTTVSYVGDDEYKELAMQLGLFLVEVKMMDATIAKLK